MPGSIHHRARRVRPARVVRLRRRGGTVVCETRLRSVPCWGVGDLTDCGHAVYVDDHGGCAVSESGDSHASQPHFLSFKFVFGSAASFFQLWPCTILILSLSLLCLLCYSLVLRAGSGTSPCVRLLLVARPRILLTRITDQRRQPAHQILAISNSARTHVSGQS